MFDLKLNKLDTKSKAYQGFYQDGHIVTFISQEFLNSLYKYEIEFDFDVCDEVLYDSWGESADFYMVTNDIPKDILAIYEANFDLANYRCKRYECTMDTARRLSKLYKSTIEAIDGVISAPPVKHKGCFRLD